MLAFWCGFSLCVQRREQYNRMQNTLNRHSCVLTASCIQIRIIVAATTYINDSSRCALTAEKSSAESCCHYEYRFTCVRHSDNAVALLHIVMRRTAFIFPRDVDTYWMSQLALFREIGISFPLVSVNGTEASSKKFADSHFVPHQICGWNSTKCVK